MSWIAIIITFILQETASMTAALVYIHQQGFTMWLIHGLFLVATAGDIVVGFFVGKYLHGKLVRGSRLERWLRNKTEFLKRPGWEYLLTFSGIVNFPYVNGAIGAWLDLPFWSVFFATLVGDLISYVVFWVLTIGIVHLAINVYLAMVILVVAVIICTIILEKYFFVSRV